MIEFNQAFQTMMESAVQIEKRERVALEHACGRILAEDVLADRAIPPFNRVAMDGYACRRADIAHPLEVIETIAAGHTPQKTVGENQCAKVMTGCMLPHGADMVLMVEYSEELNDGQIRCTGTEKQIAKDNVAPLGEDLQPGDLVLSAGTLIESKHIGILASMGCSEPVVVSTPLVGVISTGDEIIEPWEKPDTVQIRNSNSPQLLSQIQRLKVEYRYYGIVPDSEEALYQTIHRAADECDVVLLTGGVSMGEFDLVPGILQKNRFKILFDRIAVKPGKPTTFAVRGDAVCFGLPGNPVTAFVIFELMVKPFLYKMMGHDYMPPALYLPMEKDFVRKKADREAWSPVVLNDKGEIEFLKYHGSGHFHALARAWGLARIPKGISEFKKGSSVYVRPI